MSPHLLLGVLTSGPSAFFPPELRELRKKPPDVGPTIIFPGLGFVWSPDVPDLASGAVRIDIIFFFFMSIKKKKLTLFLFS
jgi:hypothetical protein